MFRTRTAAVYGIEAHLIDVDPGVARDVITVGMPDTAIKESRERIKSALMNSGFGYPNNSVTINLAPANDRKEGAGFDHLLTSWQHRILKRLSDGNRGWWGLEGEYCPKSRIAELLGLEAMKEFAGRRVLDFGCGDGHESVALAQAGASEVIGLDIRPEALETARKRAAAAGVQDRCRFVLEYSEPADYVVSIDAFEHFADPASILRAMHGLLVPGGKVLASFGPTWYHPLGGHLFSSMLPWGHLIFSEQALIQWRNDFKKDGAKKFENVPGGLNRMTIARFERLVRNSPFRSWQLDLVPIRKLQPLHNRLTREFTTALVRCRLER